MRDANELLNLLSKHPYLFQKTSQVQKCASWPAQQTNDYHVPGEGQKESN